MANKTFFLLIWSGQVWKVLYKRAWSLTRPIWHDDKRTTGWSLTKPAFGQHWWQIFAKKILQKKDTWKSPLSKLVLLTSSSWRGRRVPQLQSKRIRQSHTCRTRDVDGTGQVPPRVLRARVSRAPSLARSSVCESARSCHPGVGDWCSN